MANMAKALGIMVVISILLGACASQSPSPAAPAAAPAAASTSAAPVTSAAAAPAVVTSAAPVAQPTAKPKPEGTLRVGLTNIGTEVLDPFLSNKAINQFDLVYDYLIGRSFDGTGLGTVGGLATKWDLTPDALSWTFTLRKGAQWDQGYGEVTADDVKFSIERNYMNSKSVSAMSAADLQAIKSIVVVDPYTLRIDLNRPMPTLLYDPIPPIVPKKAVEKLGDKDFAANPVGSGPYRLAKTDPGVSLQFVARDNWWGGVPRYQEIDLYLIPEEATRIAMLKRGELDVADVSIPQVKTLQGQGFQLKEAAAMTILFLYHNQWEGVNAKKEVRQALRMAIDSQQLSNALFAGTGQVHSGSFPATTISKGGLPPVPTDANKAKQLLAQAGLGGGFDLQVMGVQMENMPLVAEAVAGYLQAIGVRTKITPIQQSAWSSRMRAMDLKDSVTPFPYPLNQQPVAYFFNMKYASTGLSPLRKDPQSDALVKAFMSAPTLEKMGEARTKLEEYLYNEAVEDPLLTYRTWYAAGPKIYTKDWTPSSIASRGLSIWQLYYRK